MLRRKIENKLKEWLNSDYGMLIDGARQIGKTFIIREFISAHFKHHIEINLLENKKAVSVLSQSVDSDDFMVRITALINEPLVKGETVIFLDEIQEFKSFDIITMMKFLVEKREYRFILSGSLLGIEQYGIESWPEGYMILEKMYPLDFEEFLWANGVDESLISIVRNCYNNQTAVPDYIHNKFISIFLKYLLVGGMPKAVDTFIKTNDFNRVSLDHKTIEQYYKHDVSKYALDNEKILIQTMYELLPSELNSQSKRFNLKDIPSLERNSNLGLSFGWFTKAGIAIPTYNVREPSVPLKLATNRRLVKLFHADVGILTYLLMNPQIKESILDDSMDIHFGAVYENAVAQMLKANGVEDLYYYSKNGIGEVDFLIERRNEIIPIEVKSGKDYKKHSALNNFLNTEPYNQFVKRAIVLSNNNLEIKGKILYLPIYMTMFILA